MSDSASHDSYSVLPDAPDRSGMAAGIVQAGRPVKVIALATSRISQADAALTRRIGYGLSIAVPHLNATLTVELMAHARQSARTGSGAVRGKNLSLESADGRIDLIGGARLIRALTGIDPSGIDSIEPGHRDWLTGALLTRLGRSPFVGMETVADAPSSAQSGVTYLQFSLNDGEHTMITVARAQSSTWLAMLNRSEWARFEQPVTGLSSLRVRATVRLARHSMPASALAGIIPGDLMVPDMPAFDTQGTGRIRIGAWAAHVQYSRQPAASGALTILAVENTLNTEHMDGHAEDADPSLMADLSMDMDPEHDYDDDADGDSEQQHAEIAALNAIARQQQSAAQIAGTEDDLDDYEDEHEDDHEHDGYEDEDEDHDDGLAPAAPTAPVVAAPAVKAAEAESLPPELDSVPVMLNFELGRLSLPLAALRTMGPGTVLALTQGSNAVVSITCAGRTLGQGEAVDIDGTLGIRITSWGTSC